jgi:Predicted nucleic acid-binding protein, contains PIN domain
VRVFVDTSYYVARIMPRDQRHGAAVKAVRTGMTFFTSSLIINEVISLLQSRGYFSAALTFLESAQRSEQVQITYPDPRLQTEAWDLFGRWGGSGANAVDCVSFAIMSRLGIRKAFTFDAHFHAAGFETISGARLR